jgi:hypothetical protein
MTVTRYSRKDRSYRDRGQMFGTDGHITWTEPALFDMIEHLGDAIPSHTLDEIVATRYPQAGPHCPACGSTNVTRQSLGLAWLCADCERGGFVTWDDDHDKCWHELGPETDQPSMF